MTPADFRRIALRLEGVEEYSHAGLPAFRVGGRKFASLASQGEGYGNLKLTLEQQAAFVEEAPQIFLPIPGGWGKMGHTHIRLAAANEALLIGALKTAWKQHFSRAPFQDVSGAERRGHYGSATRGQGTAGRWRRRQPAAFDGHAGLLTALARRDKKKHGRRRVCLR
jgi:hypothetical protein